MNPVRKPTWQQATALVSLSAAGAVTGFSFGHGTVAQMTSPTRIPAHLLAASEPVTAAATTETNDSKLRSQIVAVANYYLQMAKNKTPAEMEALIWQQDSLDGVDHGQSCAAFASLTLELGSRAIGQQSWVSGGGSYPWPVHDWVDARVDPNPASPNVMSVLQDAEAAHRWHPLGDGYLPQPGDWVLFDEHVEVVTKYANGVLYTIGGDSLPNFSVNAHSYRNPLSAQGVVGFVDNGQLTSDVTAATAPAARSASSTAAETGRQAAGGTDALPGLEAIQSTGTADDGQAAIPGTAAASAAHATSGALAMSGTEASTDLPASSGVLQSSGTQGVPGVQATSQAQAQDGSGSAAGSAARIPGLQAAQATPAAAKRATPAPTYRRSTATSSATSIPGTAAQQAFINQIAPGAIAAQLKYGVPAAVTIAQAIDESDWGQSELASEDNNLFGIKGAGPAGTAYYETEEYEDGTWVTENAAFQKYRNVAQSIADHGELLASDPAYEQAMADKQVPDAFANDLTGVYATNPDYGSDLIGLMKLYNLYQFDSASTSASSKGTSSQAGKSAGPGQSGAASQAGGTSGAVSADAVPVQGGMAGQTAFAGATSASAGAAAKVGSTAGGTGTGSSLVTGLPGLVDPSMPSVTSPARAQTTTPAPKMTAPSVPATPSATAAPSSSSGASTTTQPAATIQPSEAQRSTPASSADSGTPSTAASPSVSSSPSVAPSPGPAAAPSVAASPGGAAVPGTSGTASASGTANTSDSTKASGSTSASPAPTVTATEDAVIIRTGAQRSGPAARITSRAGARQISRYSAHIPQGVNSIFISKARGLLMGSAPLYADVAADAGIAWELLAACDWLQCAAQPRLSPVHGERLGAVNTDGTVYRTRSEALTQCASDLVELAMAIYWIDITARRRLSVRELASVFAAFRWGGLLKLHSISAMEFPYSVAGLTEHHLKMRWPDIKEQDAPDKPGSRFRKPFGAVPIVLNLGYPAVE